MARVEIGIGIVVAAGIVHAGYRESVERIAHDRIAFSDVWHAGRRPVIVILSCPLRMPVAQILHLMRHGIAAGFVERVVDSHAVERNAYRAHRDARRIGGKSGTRRERIVDMLRQDAVGVAIYLPRRVALRYRVGARGLINRQAVSRNGAYRAAHRVRKCGSIPIHLALDLYLFIEVPGAPMYPAAGMRGAAAVKSLLAGVDVTGFCRGRHLAVAERDRRHIKRLIVACDARSACGTCGATATAAGTGA